MPDKYPIVLVEWEDAHITSDAVRIDDAQPEMRKVVGFLFQDGERLLLGMTHDGELTQGAFIIPRGVVKKITRLRKRG